MSFALVVAEIMLLPLRQDPRSFTRLHRMPSAATLAVVVAGIVAMVFIGRPTLALHLQNEARDQVATAPLPALQKVEESLSLNPESVQAYYVKAAALARLDAYLPARAALMEAIGREPHNYVSWALLGDLLTRRGAISPALRAYSRAASLNPRDPFLKLLGSRPGLLRRLNRHPASVGAVAEAGS